MGRTGIGVKVGEKPEEKGMEEGNSYGLPTAPFPPLLNAGAGEGGTGVGNDGVKSSLGKRKGNGEGGLGLVFISHHPTLS